jgi:hypothetical protein
LFILFHHHSPYLNSKLNTIHATNAHTINSRVPSLYPPVVNGMSKRLGCLSAITRPPREYIHPTPTTFRTRSPAARCRYRALEAMSSLGTVGE